MIDLNHAVVPIEENGDNLSEPIVAESTMAGTLMEPSRAQGGAGGCSIDEIRVSGGENQPVEGSIVDRGIIGEVDVGGVSSLGYEAEENGRTSLLERSLGGNEEGGVIADEKRDEDGGDINMMNLVVDLNSRDNELNLVDGVRELSDDLPGNGHGGVDGVDSNSNQDAIVKEHATDVEQQEHIKREPFGEERRDEKDGEFHVSDLVWGKVRSHPWWPGQIFDTSAASKKAMKYSKKHGFLVAYFGDQTFAWNDASRIKPFRMHFSEMGKQSNSDTFWHAVNSALDEVARRVEFGLACSCLSDEAYGKIKTQVIANAGICKESNRRDGGDSFSSAVSFMPEKFIHYLKALAHAPSGGTDRLEFVIARAQLLAFNRWKGYDQLLVVRLRHGSLENAADIPALVTEKNSDTVPASKDEEQASSGKGKSHVQNSSSRKRKQVSSNSGFPNKKERCLLDLLSNSSSSLAEKAEENASGKIFPLSSGKKRKAGEFKSNDSKVSSRKTGISPGTVDGSSPRRLLKIGERISRIASQFSGSSPVSPVLKFNGKKSQKNIGDNSRNPARAPPQVSAPNTKKSGRVMVVPEKYPPVREMLSQLCLAATDPLSGYGVLISIARFFPDFRNSICLENSYLQNDKGSNGKVSAKQRVKNLTKSEHTETFGFEGMEDSYWTDRIIQSNPEEQVLFETEAAAEGVLTAERAALDSSPKSEFKQKAAVPNLGPEAGKDEKSIEYSPTVLILNFKDLDSLPSKENLNQIFTRFGPLIESETEVLKKRKRAKVVFKRSCDADTAFSSAGKFETFGPSLVTYTLTPRKASTTRATNRKAGNAV
ncbi:hypothetical protein RJ639_030570 [Escallonia herrerae]|uniref:PWWP domain-containing protein n=1 Tax=Escallonia herrerae TaxID=1293975 RepID=A0AA88X4A0_9ASTE|nr:hypothetical protein RJ639_030570 [Escallonia herrerae]